jgi:hypothetical protein
MPGLPALVRLAGALGVRVERFAEGVEDPEGDEAVELADPLGPTPKRPRRKKEG